MAPSPEDQRTTKLWESMARILCEMADANPDFRMWDGQPFWKWQMHRPEDRARIQAAINALSGRL